MKRRQSWGPSELREKLEEIFELTEEDVKREFTTQELEELCRRRRCYVDMPKWNAVHDYVLRFTRENRLAKRSPEAKLRLLARAVNTHKDHAVYTDADIGPEMEREWRFRKRQSVCLLDMWEQNRHEQRKAKVAMRLAQLEELGGYVDRPMDDDVTVNRTSQMQLANAVGPHAKKRAHETLDDDMSAAPDELEGTQESIMNSCDLLALLMPSQSSETQRLESQSLMLESQLASINGDSAVVSPPLAEQISDKNNNDGYKRVNNFFQALNTESMSLSSQLDSQVMSSAEIGESHPVSLPSENLFSEDFAAILPTATSTQNLDNN